MAKTLKEQKLSNGLSFSIKQSSPPPRFTEATLVKKLESSGVGRPSTYATIVETVLSESRGYAELQDKAIVPTERGIQLAAFLDRAFPDLININYTNNMEKDLDKIAEGKLTKLEFLNKFYNTLETSVKNNPEGHYEEQNITCPLCGAKMVARRNKYGKMFYGCSTWPKCNGLLNTSDIAKLQKK